MALFIAIWLACNLDVDNWINDIQQMKWEKSLKCSELNIVFL